MKLIRALISAIQEFLLSSEKPIEEKPVPKEQLLNSMCMAIQRHEGWILNPPSRSVRNNNPGNLKFVGQPHAHKEANGPFAVFDTYEHGLNALKSMILRGAKGESSIYHPYDNLYDFFKKYAPASDDNQPLIYAEAVAKYMNVNPVKWRLRELI